jgi:hypothetical protein
MKEQNFNKHGFQAQDNERVFASRMFGKEQQLTKVLVYNNAIYDPLGSDSNRENTLDLKLKKVKIPIFGLYLQYLRTKNKTYFLQAQRAFNND